MNKIGGGAEQAARPALNLAGFAMEKYSLKGKVVCITGGSSGIGKALATACLGRGARVALCGRNLSRLQEAFPAATDELLLVQADVARKADCAAFIAAARKKWGRIDVLINNAGISMRALFSAVDTAVLEEVMNINFWGTVHCSKAALPDIMASGGAIVGISSIAGYRGLPGRTAYSASKAAMQAFLEALRTELLFKGVNVLWVAPGFTASNIRNTALAADGTAQGETPLQESSLMSAEACAGHILKAIEQRKRDVVLTGQGKLTVWLNRLLPGLADKLVYNHFRKEPDSPLK